MWITLHFMWITAHKNVDNFAYYVDNSAKNVDNLTQNCGKVGAWHIKNAYLLYAFYINSSSNDFFCSSAFFVVSRISATLSYSGIFTVSKDTILFGAFSVFLARQHRIVFTFLYFGIEHIIGDDIYYFTNSAVKEG